MILKIKKDIIVSNNRVDIIDEDNKLMAFVQGDFSYKNRRHLYDSFGNEVGYCQLAIDKTCARIYDGKNDELFGIIYFEENEYKPSFVDWTILVNEHYRIVDSNSEEIMHISEDEDYYILNIKENKNDLNSVLCLLGLFDYIKDKGGKL